MNSSLSRIHFAIGLLFLFCDIASTRRTMEEKRHLKSNLMKCWEKYESKTLICEGRDRGCCALLRVKNFSRPRRAKLAKKTGRQFMTKFADNGFDDFDFQKLRFEHDVKDFIRDRGSIAFSKDLVRDQEVDAYNEVLPNEDKKFHWKKQPKIPAWHQKSSVLSNISGHPSNYQPTSSTNEPLFFNFDANRLPTTTTTTTTETPISEHVPVFRSGQRRGMVKSSPGSNESDVDQGLDYRSYTDDLCAKLKVPCRFVSDHICCKYKMNLEMVARARAMDGSADLKWRTRDRFLLKPLEVVGGPRSHGQGRSLSFGTESVKKTEPTLSSKMRYNIRYNHAITKTGVTIPRYYYKGGPDLTHTILGMCWRLHYLHCPTAENSRNGRDHILRNQSPVHPCCKLVSKPGAKSLITNRVSRWMQL